MLAPKKTKYRRVQVGRVNPKKKRCAGRGKEVSFGDWGMQALTGARIRSNQIESARRVITRTAGKGSKIWIRIFPDRPFTKKGAGTPMGKGKGLPAGFEVEVLPGRVLFEITGVSKEISLLSLTKAGKKLPVRTRVIERHSV